MANPLPGNPHISADDVHVRDAVLALAFEQRTANDIAYLQLAATGQLTGARPDGNWRELEGEIRTRLGLDEVQA